MAKREEGSSVFLWHAPFGKRWLPLAMAPNWKFWDMRQRQNYLSGVYSFGVRTSRIVLQVLLKKDIPYRFAGRGYGTHPCPRACYQTILCRDSANETATEWKLPQAGVPRYKATRRPKRNPCKQSNSHHEPQIPFSPSQT